MEENKNQTEQNNAQNKILTQRGYHRLCKGNKGTDEGKQRNGYDRDEQRQHDHPELLRHADDARGIQDCHHHDDEHGDQQCERAEIFKASQHLENKE